MVINRSRCKVVNMDFDHKRKMIEIEIKKMKQIEWWKRDRNRKNKKLAVKVGDCFNRGNTCFGGIYYKLCNYARSQGYDMSGLEIFTQIADVVRWEKFTVDFKYWHDINRAIDATEDFLDSIVYFKYRDLRNRFKDMMLLVIYAKRAIFDQESKDFDDKHDYWEKIKGLINVYDWIFIEELKFFREIKSEKHRFFLLGKLLVIAGYPKYDKAEGLYDSEAEYFYKSLNIIGMIEGREVFE